MELVQFLIWVLVIWLDSFLLSVVLLKTVHFKQKPKVLQLSLIIALFASLLFGIITKPYITYNNCSNYNIKYSIFTLPVIKCPQALWLILLFFYLAGYIWLYLILFN